MKEKRGNKWSLPFLYLIVFSAFFDTHAQMPILAPYALSLGATPFALGLVIGAYSFFNIAGNFSGGATIDRKSWREPLFVGLIGVTAALFLYTLAGNVYQLMLIRAGHGFMGGILVPAALACLTADDAMKSLHGPRLAFFGATIGLAAITGPMTAGVIAGIYHYHGVYYFLAGLLFTATVFCLFLLKSKEPCSAAAGAQVVTYREILAGTDLKQASIFAFGAMGSTGALASFLPLRAASLGLGHAQTGMLFATFALIAIIIQVAWPKTLKSMLKENCRGCMLGLFFMAAALVLAASVNAAPGLFPALALFGAGFGFTFQGMLGLVIESAKPQWRGRAIGLFFATYSLGVALVPPLSGLIWQTAPSVFPFYTAAGIALLCLVVGGKLS